MIGDLLQLGDAAGVRDVGLDVGGGLLLEHLAETPACEEALAGGDGERDVVGDELERVDVFLRHRLLDEHRAHALQFVADLDGEGRRHLAVEVEGQLHLRADPLAHQVGALDEVVDDSRRLVAAPLAAGPDLKAV